MSFLRPLLVLGLLSLAACGVEGVGAPGGGPATPMGAHAVHVEGNTPTSGERPHATERASSAGHASHASELRSFGSSCRRCFH